MDTPKLAYTKDLMTQSCMETTSFTSSNDQSKLLYTALYDYTATLDKNLSMYRGDQLYVLNYNASKEWCEVQNAQTNNIGWVPSSYIKPFNSVCDKKLNSKRISNSSYIHVYFPKF